MFCRECSFYISGRLSSFLKILVNNCYTEVNEIWKKWLVKRSVSIYFWHRDFRKSPPPLHRSWETTTQFESQPIHSFGIVAAEACHRLRRIIPRLGAPQHPEQAAFLWEALKHAELCSAVLWISSLRLKPCEAEVDRSHRGTENGSTSMGQLPTPHIIILRNCSFPYKAILGLVNLRLEELPRKLNTGNSQCTKIQSTVIQNSTMTWSQEKYRKKYFLLMITH